MAEHRTLFEPCGDLALDLVNTVVPGRQGSVDLLHTPDDLRSWLELAASGDTGGGGHARGITFPLTSFPLTLPERRWLLDEALRLRAAIRRLLESISSPAAPAETAMSEPAVFAIDRVLAAGRTRSRFSVTAGSPLLLTRHEPMGALGLLAPVALAAARLAVEADRARLRTCAAEGCPRWFLDTSKGGRRRWCSMATCGNRAKAARFRERRETAD